MEQYEPKTQIEARPDLKNNPKLNEDFSPVVARNTSQNVMPVVSQKTHESLVLPSPILDKRRIKLVWTGPGLYKKFEWKGMSLYHRNLKPEGMLYREQPKNDDTIMVIDIGVYGQKKSLENLLKQQLLEDLARIGLKITQDMREWALHGTKYCYQFIPALDGEIIVKLQNSEWRGCVWSSSHHTILTIHPRYTNILYAE